MHDDDDVDRRWRAANRVPDGISHTDVSRELMDAIRAQIVAMGRPVASRRRSRRWFSARRRGAVLGSVVGLLAVGAATAATLELTYTVDGAPGSCQILLKAAGATRYPAGYGAWRNLVLLDATNPRIGTSLRQACDDPSGKHIAKGPGVRGGTYAEPINVFRAEVAQSAFCAWSSEWLTAKRSGDTAAASRAASEIAVAIPWPAVSKELERNRVSWFTPVQRAVRAGDISAVASMWKDTGRGKQVYQCWIFQPADNTKNGTVYVPRPRVCLLVRMTSVGETPEAWFNRLYRTSSDDVLAYLLRRSRTPEDAADALAETYTAAWRKLESLPNGDRARLWLFGAARIELQKAASRNKADDVLVTMLANELATTLSQEQELIDRDEALWSAVTRLSATDREILALTAWEGLTPREIATVIGISGNAVRLRLSRARRVLRTHLNHHDRARALTGSPVKVTRTGAQPRE